MSTTPTAPTGVLPTTHCAPYAKHQDVVCMSHDDLLEGARAVGYTPSPAAAQDRSTLWHELQTHVLTPDKAPCKDKGICLVDHKDVSPEVKDRLLQAAFRPRKPITWLGDKEFWVFEDELNDHMKQYERVYPTFKFMGCVALDFAEPSSTSPNHRHDGHGQCADPTSNLCNEIDINQLGNITQIGFIVNMDKHNEAGSHWTGLLVDIARGFIAYFDSFALAIPMEIIKFVDKLQRQASLPASTVPNHRFQVHINRNQYQQRDGDCGIYASHFIIRLLQGETPQQVLNTPTSEWNDKLMSHYRHEVYFSPAVPATKEEIKAELLKKDPDLRQDSQKLAKLQLSGQGRGASMSHQRKRQKRKKQSWRQSPMALQDVYQISRSSR